MRCHARPRLDEILVPLDGSRRAEAALPAALGMATLFSARLALIQAVEPVAMMADVPVAFPQALDEELTALRRREAQDYLDGVAERRSRESGRRDPRERRARPQRGGRHPGRGNEPGRGNDRAGNAGHGGLRRLVLGSIADKLVRTGKCRCW